MSFLNREVKKYVPLLTIFALVLILFIIRLLSHTEIDDVAPRTQCLDELIDRSDVLWVIPLLENDSISEHREWCEYIKGKNKTLGLHGVYHTYKEFSYARDSEYIERGIRAFEECFNKTPTMFKPPQIAFTAENKDLLERRGLKYYGKWSQLTHKVYHCSDTGEFPNWLIKVF